MRPKDWRFLGAALLPATLAAWAAAPLTERCNTTNTTDVSISFQSAEALVRVKALIETPAADRQVFDRVWQPAAVASSYSGFEFFNISLRYPYAQDVQHIAESIRQDPYLRGLGMTNAAFSQYACLPLQPRFRKTVTEYHNTTLDHYFLSSSPEENSHLDSGAAGTGWSRTGETFESIVDVCDDETIVYRFYGERGIGPNSHFFTREGAECGALRRAQYAGWLMEGEAFRASPLYGGQCSAGKRPVLRLYNNRAPQNDANHRYVVRQGLYESMQARGWIGEGPAFCVPQ